MLIYFTCVRLLGGAPTSICHFFHPSICSSICLSINPTAHPFLCPSICPHHISGTIHYVIIVFCTPAHLLHMCKTFRWGTHLYMSLFLSIHLFIHLSVHQSDCPSIRLSIRLSIHPSTPYFRNHTSCNHCFLYTCLKWWYLQVFFSFFLKFWYFWLLEG